MTRVRPRIVAVFGGNAVGRDVLQLAVRLGQRIAENHAIVLTGGDGGSRGEVKQEAVAGARGHGSWIGVLNSRGGAAHHRATERGFVLDARMGHQRNLLEAALCDAAVVLEGGDGTVSELVASLCLGRPVLLVGETWRTGWPELVALFRDPSTADAGDTARLVQTARRRLDVRNGPMAADVRTTIVQDRLRTTPSCRYVDLAHAPAVAGQWLESLAETPRAGALPRVDHFDAVRAPYADWTARQLR
jgi:uncharacterized protein (TIGR00725 family)